MIELQRQDTRKLGPRRLIRVLKEGVYEEGL
jgi:hypothetical protein